MRQLQTIPFYLKIDLQGAQRRLSDACAHFKFVMLECENNVRIFDAKARMFFIVKFLRNDASTDA